MALTKVKGHIIADDLALGGNPTTSTQSTGNNTTRIATTAFVQTELAALVDSSPSALNTLNELAAALGDDANFSTTVNTNIAAKLPLAGGTMTGSLGVGDTAVSSIIGLFSTSTANHIAGQFVNSNASDSFGIVVKAGNDANDYTADFRDKANNNLMRIRGDGNVGIGTTSPAKTLDVKGRMQLTRPVASGHASEGNWDFNISHEDAARYGSLYITPSVSTAEISLMSNKFRFTNDGKLGIGVTDPSGAPVSLSVFGSGTSSPSASNATTSYSNAMFRINHFGNSSVGLSIGSAGSNVTYIQTSYNEGTTSPLLINPYASDAATSFVGIGPIAAPVASVHIKPTGNSWEHGLLLQHDNANTGWMIHPEQQDSSLWFGYNANTGAAITDQTASEYVVFDSSGGVGIGNSRPSTNAHSGANNLVIGSTSTGDNGMTILGNANNTGRIFFGDPDLNRSGQIEYVHNGDILQFYAGNALSTKMIEGKFGVNVSPSETLHTYAASGSNEYRNQLGSQSIYMRHGVTRNTPQGTSVFDILALSNQDIVVGTSNMFLVGDGGMHNSEGTNRLRVDGNGVTIGEVLPTLTTTNESVLRRLWVRGQGVFHSQDQGTLLPRARTAALNIGPSGTRGNTGNPGTAAYNATTPTGHVSGGIAWDHLMNYSTYGNMGYNSKPHGWLGMELHSTPGHELSNMIMCTREGSASTAEPLIAQRWYATGEITTPRNPAFHAYGTAMSNQTTEGNHGNWVEVFDRSGDYVGGTTNVFTAPVDGVYAFYAHSNFNTGVSTPYYFRAVKNNALKGIFYGSGASQGWDHIMAFITIVLDKNDTFEWYYKGDPDEGAEWAQCGGYLIG